MWYGIAAIVLIGACAIGFYNNLVTLRQRVNNSWAQIDVQLRRRFDLIPNLVETVKGYASHEQEVFQKVTEARTRVERAYKADDVGQQVQAQTAFGGAIRGLLAVAEAYPDLKANDNFKHLQAELSDTESKIAYSRQFYNDTVMKYAAATQRFPGNIFAGAFGFGPLAYYVAEGESRGPVKVQF